MDKKLVLIFDYPHGKDVAGKCSPDGRHKEWIWGRERLNSIASLVKDLGYTVEFSNLKDTEIGLTNRKAAANLLAKQYPDKVPFLISLHNDALNATPEWQSRATGISVWTSRGRTNSDIFADYFIENIPNYLPEVKIRRYSPTPLDKDFEANFTVLMGNYIAILIECMFQDNKEDLAKLEDPEFCSRVDQWIVDSIEKCNKYLISKLRK